MKFCTMCSQDKPLSDFNRKGEGRQPWCRDCHKEWYRENKSQHIKNVKKNTFRYREDGWKTILDYLSTHPCVDCGEADLVVLEFDHVRGVKEYTVSRMPVDGFSVKSIEAEIAKCEVRCANCHRRATARRSGNWRRSTHL